MSSNRRILVVEDEPLIAMDIQAELESRGWDVVGSVGTVARALHLLDSEDITVALLDINLRGTDSFEIAEVLERRNIPFVFLTGDSSEVRRDSFRARTLLSKPIDYPRLHAVLEAEAQGSD